MFQSKDLTATVLPGQGMFLGPTCRISATEEGKPECAAHSVVPRSPKTPKQPPQKASVLCKKDPGYEHGRGSQHAASLEKLRRELRQALYPT